MAKATKRKSPKDPPVATVKPSDYQPSAKELRQDLRVNVQFEKALGSLVKPIKTKTERRPPA